MEHTQKTIQFCKEIQALTGRKPDFWKLVNEKSQDISKAINQYQTHNDLGPVEKYLCPLA